MWSLLTTAVCALCSSASTAPWSLSPTNCCMYMHEDSAVSIATVIHTLLAQQVHASSCWFSFVVLLVLVVAVSYLSQYITQGTSTELFHFRQRG